jgi:hypothetical protein
VRRELLRSAKHEELRRASDDRPKRIHRPDIGIRHAVEEPRAVDNRAIGTDVAVLKDDPDTLRWRYRQVEHSQPEAVNPNACLALAHASEEPRFREWQAANPGLPRHLLRHLGGEGDGTLVRRLAVIDSRRGAQLIPVRENAQAAAGGVGGALEVHIDHHVDPVLPDEQRALATDECQIGVSKVGISVTVLVL